MKQKVQGIAVSNGIAIGPCWIYRPFVVKVERCKINDPDQELDRLENALAEARQQLSALYGRALASVGASEAAIFEAHQLFLDDPEFSGAIRAAIQDECINAEAAVAEVMEFFASQMLALEDEYFQARAQDIRDVSRRVLYCLNGISLDQLQPLRPVVILAEELTPSDTIQFDRQMILGLCTQHGGPTSHTAILARSLAVPAAVNVPFELSSLSDGTVVILDGSAGILTCEPDEDELADARRKQATWKDTWQAQLRAASLPAQTRDGHAVEIVANIGGVEDARQAIDFGAEGIGLLRTEFLYLDYGRLPSEEEQVAIYREILQVMGKRPVVVRTLDIGGDKPVDYLDLRPETNPFLGWRAIRMMRDHPDVLLTQLRALLRATSSENDLRIMVPMVSCVEEVKQARQLFDGALDSLRHENLVAAERIQFGIMVEVPSAALISEHLAEYVDFFSIGTNDLTQYTLAVDRTNERVAYLASPFHPAVLHLIAHTITMAHEKGRWVGLCGEMAGDPLAAPLLVGLGLDEFSMAPSSIPVVKELVRKLAVQECLEIANLALAQPDTAAVRSLLENWLSRLA
jgi:phosphoenolpyruvate-protein phosphotransferase